VVGLKLAQEAPGADVGAHEVEADVHLGNKRVAGDLEVGLFGTYEWWALTPGATAPVASFASPLLRAYAAGEEER
jgi:hypothetical protein